MEEKYKLTEESINYCGKILYRIEALKDFANVKKGDKGGYIENENNLSQEGDCWIYGNTRVSDKAIVCGNAKVYNSAVICDNAVVYDDAEVSGDAQVYDNAIVSGNVLVYDDAKVCGNAEVYGYVQVCGSAEIKDNSDYIVFKNWWSSGRYFTWTKSNNMWKVGCFYGTGEELIAKAYEDSELSGKEYKRVVDYVESILQDSKGIGD